MAWGKLEDTFSDHPKFYRLAEALAMHVCQARGHVATLWSWAYRHAPDGDLRTFSDADIARAAQYEGAPSDFVVCLTNVSILDKKHHGFVLHGFWERAESNKAAIRKRDSRRRGHRTVPRQSQDSTVTVTAMSRLEERRGEDKEEIRGEEIILPLRKSDSASPSPVSLIRKAWLDAYEQVYDRKCESWGARESGQAKNLLKSWPLERLLALIPAYFAWKEPRAIRAGHPFGTGADSFVMRIHALDADTHSYERRDDAAVFGAQLREANERAVTDWALGGANGLSAQNK